jgi:hypothetical protein
MRQCRQAHAEALREFHQICEQSPPRVIDLSPPCTTAIRQLIFFLLLAKQALLILSMLEAEEQTINVLCIHGLLVSVVG